MLQVTPSLSIDEKVLSFVSLHASGPGGQNVNKVSSAVQLRFDLRAASLAPEVKNRVASLAGRRMNKNGILVIEAKRYRSQEQNRMDATRRLAALILQALAKPEPRRATRPSRVAQRRRVEAKMHRARIKKLRSQKGPPSD